MIDGMANFHMWAWKTICIIMFTIIGILLSIVAWSLIKDKKKC